MGRHTLNKHTLFGVNDEPMVGRMHDMVTPGRNLGIDLTISIVRANKDQVIGDLPRVAILISFWARPVIVE